MCDVGQYCWSSANFCSKNKECSEIVTEAKKQTSNNGDGDNGLRRSLDSVSINSKACSCVGSQEAQSCSADVNGLWCGTSTGKEGARCAWTRAGLYYARLTDKWSTAFHGVTNSGVKSKDKDIPVGPLGEEYFVVGSDKKEKYHNIHDAVRKYSMLIQDGVENLIKYGPINNVFYSSKDNTWTNIQIYNGQIPGINALELFGPINEWDVSRITDLRCLFSTNGEPFGGSSAGKILKTKNFC